MCGRRIKLARELKRVPGGVGCPLLLLLESINAVHMYLSLRQVCYV